MHGYDPGAASLMGLLKRIQSRVLVSETATVNAKRLEEILSREQMEATPDQQGNLWRRETVS